MTMMLALALVALVLAIAVVAFLILWQPHAPVDTLDQCEVCGRPATHELASAPKAHAGRGFSAMVACYCKSDAPAGAVKVR
jgi:hypothetical protein